MNTEQRCLISKITLRSLTKIAWIAFNMARPWGIDVLEHIACGGTFFCCSYLSLHLVYYNDLGPLMSNRCPYADALKFVPQT